MKKKASSRRITKHYFNKNFLNLLDLTQFNIKYCKRYIYYRCCNLYSQNKLIDFKDKYFPELDNYQKEDDFLYEYIKNQIRMQIIDKPEKYLLLNKLGTCYIPECNIYL